MAGKPQPNSLRNRLTTCPTTCFWTLDWTPDYDNVLRWYRKRFPKPHRSIRSIARAIAAEAHRRRVEGRT